MTEPLTDDEVGIIRNRMAAVDRDRDRITIHPGDVPRLIATIDALKEQLNAADLVAKERMKERIATKVRDNATIAELTAERDAAYERAAALCDAILETFIIVREVMRGPHYAETPSAH